MSDFLGADKAAYSTRCHWCCHSYPKEIATLISMRCASKMRRHVAIVLVGVFDSNVFPGVWQCPLHSKAFHDSSKECAIVHSMDSGEYLGGPLLIINSRIQANRERHIKSRDRGRNKPTETRTETSTVSVGLGGGSGVGGVWMRGDGGSGAGGLHLHMGRGPPTAFV